MTFKKILVATDFSPIADEAMRTAAELSGRYSAPLTLVYVYEPLTYALPASHVAYTSLQVRELMAVFEQRLANSRVEAEAVGAFGVETKLLIGAASGEISDYAATQNFDLVTIGTHGLRGLSHLLLGSVAERVVRTAPCPVLTIRRHETPSSNPEKGRVTQ